jgi:hypothetical protein
MSKRPLRLLSLAEPAIISLCGFLRFSPCAQEFFSRIAHHQNLSGKFSAGTRFGLFVLGIVFLIFAVPAQASTVVLQGGFGYPVTKAATGGAIDPGFEVSVGAFDAGFDPTAAPSDLPALLAAWNEYAKTTTAVIDGVAGSFYLKHINNDPAFAGKKIHLFFTRTKSSGYSATAQASTARSNWDFPLTEQIVADTTDTTDTETVRAFPVFPEGTDTAKAFFRIQVQAVGQD